MQRSASNITASIRVANPQTVEIIDQRFLPHQLVIEPLRKWQDAATAIREMHVRGAPLIGVTAAYGMYLATLEAQGQDIPDNFFVQVAENLKATRPTAINLEWAVHQQLELINSIVGSKERVEASLSLANDIRQAEIDRCYQIGQHGLALIKEMASHKKGQSVNVLTHCNAGALACVKHGTATAPIYAAHRSGIPVHVWVDETRPRNQGARLTAWELEQAGVPHTVIPDNTGGHLMQHGMVDCCFVGSDRTTRTGDVANKIGTYLKALAAKDNNVPFYVALPVSTFDWNIGDGLKEIPIEQRNAEEVRFIQGFDGEKINKVLVPPTQSAVANYGFDVTPAHLVTALVTERGICEANENAIGAMFPEYL